MSVQEPLVGMSELPAAPLRGSLLERIHLERRVAELEAEVEHLRTALESRTTTATATGMLAERFGCTSPQGWALLRRVSSHANVKVRDVASVVVALADGTANDEDAGLLERIAPHLPRLDRTT